LSGGFPDFVGGPNLTALLSGALARDGLISDLEGFVLDDFRATELRPVVGFLSLIWRCPLPHNGNGIRGFPPFFQLSKCTLHDVPLGS
jgi:hypothetical protein